MNVDVGYCKGQIPTDPGAGFGHGLVGMEISSSYLIDRQSRSTKTLSRHAPLPSIEMAPSAFFSTAVKLMEVNCDPWSVLTISGLPYQASGSSTASMQKAASIVIDSRHDRTSG